MIPYYLLLLFPLTVCFLGQTVRLTLNKRLLFKTQSSSIDTFMLIFVLLLSLRGIQCGIDTRQYYILYTQYSSHSISELIADYKLEWGYKILNKLIDLTVGDFQALLCITSILCVLPVWCFYRKESENPLLTIALFLAVAPFQLYFSGIRQAIAMAMVVPAWYAAKHKCPGAFLFSVFIAMLFHTSAFIMLPLYPLYWAKITKKWLWFVIPSIIGIYYFRATIFNILIKLLWQDFKRSSETGAIMVLILLSLFAVYSYVLPDEKKLDQDTIAMRNILLLSTVIQIFAMLHPLSMRMNYYFLLFIPVLLPKIANRREKKFAGIAQLSVIVMTVYFLCFFLNNAVNGADSLNIFPYIPFWE